MREAVDRRAPKHHAWGVLAFVLAILALGLLVIFHEFGHYWVAKRSGMSVSRFSIGFGPVLYQTERDGTLFQVAAVPLGGFVQIDGMDPEDELEDPSKSYEAKPFHLKFATILAGPVANYLLGFAFLFMFYAAFNYEPLPPIEVVKVTPDSPAAVAGIEQGDLLFGTQAGPYKKVEDFAKSIQDSGGAPIIFTLRRGGQEQKVEVTPRDAAGRYLVGIAFEGAERREDPLSLGEAVVTAATKVVSTSGMILRVVPRLFQKGSGADLTGPLGIIRELARQMKRSWQDTLPVIAQLSIMLGLFNLFPIPALDGSRLLFLLIGFVRRRPVSPKLENYVHFAGMLLMLGLFIVISYKDVVRWITE